MSSTTDWSDPDYRLLRLTIRRLLEQPSLTVRLKSSDSAKQTMADLGIHSDDMRVAIINVFDAIKPYIASGDPTAASPGPGDRDAAPGDMERSRAVTSATTFFEDAFLQLRRAYWLSITMSVVMFVFGIAFLVLAGYQAIVRPDNAVTTAVVGGIGVVQIVALFYRNPLADIARSVANAQQAKIAVTSYVLGITFIHDSIGFGSPTEAHIRSLLEVTDKALSHLQVYRDSHPSSIERPARRAGETSGAGEHSDPK